MGTSVPGVCPRAGTIYGWLSGAPVCAVTMAAPAQQPNPGVRNAHAAVYDTRSIRSSCSSGVTLSEADLHDPASAPDHPPGVLVRERHGPEVEEVGQLVPGVALVG